MNERLNPEKTLQEIMKEQSPRNIKHLAMLAAPKLDLSKSEIYTLIGKMEKDSKINFCPFDRTLPENVNKFFLNKNYFSIEFWTIVSLSISLVLSVFFISPSSSFVFIRVILGMIFCFFLLGWSFTNILFPRLYVRIDQFERLLIAFGFSILYTIICALFVNVIWEINALSIAISIGSFTLLLHIISTSLRILIILKKIVPSPLIEEK